MISDNVIPFVHACLRRALRPGDNAVDATAGNGADTVFLAQCVGATGKVWAFDIQEAALRLTRERLRRAGLEKRVNLLPVGHERLAEFVPAARATVFNLGWLPGGDKGIVTSAETTLAALDAAAAVTAPGGIIATVIYGHPAGREEAAVITERARNLPQKEWQVLCYRFANRPPTAPYAMIFEKLA